MRSGVGFVVVESARNLVNRRGQILLERTIPSGEKIEAIGDPEERS